MAAFSPPYRVFAVDAPVSYRCDLAASGITLNGTSDVAVSGNVFSGVTPKALAVEGDPSRRVLFSNNVLTNTACEQAKLRDSRAGENSEDGPARPAGGR